ncbi:tetratricopeptide repeat protein [Prevotella melaninogenica]|uniref:tetratricopeptide repeat protein n=1 Tax=Prevotella melaninogenica TaxID=28132 RepID=UPI0020138ED1|nr:tetratricopeptide repeat protein [Prevotella melaninogenica]
MVKRLYIIICMLLVFVGCNAQTANQLIREGNKLFSSKNYAQAEILYHKAIDKDGSNAIANYNLGRCLQAQKKNEEAKKLYDNAAKLEKDPVRLSSSYNNLGTILQGENNYEKAIEAYKSALRSNPNHKNARYNLELCKRKLKQQQNQQSSDKNKNKSDKDKEKKKNQPQNQNQKNNNQKNNQKNKQQKDNQGMSKDNAEQLLNAVKQQEKETQERLSKVMRQPSDKKLDKNW